MTPQFRWPFSMEYFYAMNEFTPVPLPSPPSSSLKANSKMSNRRLRFRWPFSMKYFYAMNEFPPLSPASSSSSSSTTADVTTPTKAAGTTTSIGEEGSTPGESRSRLEIHEKPSTHQSKQTSEDADSIRAARWLKSHVGERFKMAPSDNSTFEPRLRDQVFDTKDFQSCLTNTRTTLVLQGMPGVGKTTTMQGLIARVADRDKSRLNSKVVTAALCIRDTRDLGFERVISSALLYLLQVICKQVPDSMEAVKTLHQKVPAGRLPPASVITTAIQHVLTRVERTCIFIDSGADEFYDFSDLLAQLKLLQQKTNIGIVFTSDGDLDNFILEKHFRNLKFHTLTISANSEDIAAYLRKRFARKMDKGLVDSLASGISEAANGIFLVAQLYCLLLKSFEKDADIRRELRELQRQQLQYPGPMGAEIAIRLALKSVLERVFHPERSQEEKRIAESTMELVRYTRYRPLSIKQLLWSLDTDKGGILHPPKTFYDWTYINPCCYGLLKDDGFGNVVFLHGFIHESLGPHKGKTIKDCIDRL